MKTKINLANKILLFRCKYCGRRIQVVVGLCIDCLYGIDDIFEDKPIFDDEWSNE